VRSPVADEVQTLASRSGDAEGLLYEFAWLISTPDRPIPARIVGEVVDAPSAAMHFTGFVWQRTVPPCLSSVSR
jgi:hypothetical protein